jgi:hypothetical protein
MFGAAKKLVEYMWRINIAKMSLAVASVLAAGVAGNFTYDCLKPIWESPPNDTGTPSKRASTSLPRLVKGWEIELAGTKAILAELDDSNTGRSYAAQKAFNVSGPSLPHLSPKNVVQIIGNIYVHDTNDGNAGCKHPTYAEVNFSIRSPEFVTDGSTAKGMYCRDGETEEEGGLKAIGVAVEVLKMKVHKATLAELAEQSRNVRLAAENANLNSGPRAAWAKCIPCWLYEQGCKPFE